MGLLNFSDTSDYIKKHDIIYGSPLCDPLAGLPIGDGDIGSLLWLEEDGLHININKTDLWDKSSFDDDCCCSGIQEDLTCLRHGGEVTVKFNSPCFDLTYQKEFEGRLRLSSATAEINSATAFSDIKIKAFASNESKVTAVKFNVITAEDESPEISFIRYGSKNSWRWYSQISDRPEAGLTGTETKALGKRVYITQKLNGTIFCLGFSLVINDDLSAERINSHVAKVVLKSKKEQEFILYYNISLGENEHDAANKCREILDKAEIKGYDSIFSRHKASWANFWNKSFIKIPDEYIENLWYLSLYYSQSECRGAYAPHFTNGIWGFKHDFVPWTYYFHYNMQHMYAPLEASGHGDLAENYYKMRRKGLSIAYEYAKQKKNKKGAFYHDVTDYLGRCAEYDSDNCTPGPQIALAMYRHYKMNGDEGFLKNSALPVMKGTAEFYLDLLGEKEGDGLYHIHGTTAYEGTPLFDDTITDYVSIKALFNALISLNDEFVSKEEKEVYSEVLNNLPDYLYSSLYEGEEIENGIIKLGIGKGQKVNNNGEVLAIGKLKGKTMRKTFGDYSRDYYGFPDTEMSPLYPAGIIGIKDKGTRVYEAIKNSILIHHEPKDCMNWCMMPQYLARIGMSDLLFPYLRKTVSSWQTFPNGLGVDGGGAVEDAKLRFKYNHAKDCDTEYHTYLEGFYFRHFDMEALPIIASAVNEALLQSYDGVIRILPTIKKEENTAFTLYAEGGFKVSCEAINGALNILIEKLRNESCLIKLPEFTDRETLKYYKVSDGKCAEFTPEFINTGSEEVISLKESFIKGDKLFITNGKAAEVSAYETKENLMWKTCGKAQLGTPPLISFSVKNDIDVTDNEFEKDYVAEAMETILTE